MAFKAPNPPPEGFEDNPEWTEADFARARPADEVLPAEVLAAFGKPRGRPKQAVVKQAVSLRLSPQVVEHFKASGPGWQARIDALLLQAVELSEKAVGKRA